MWNLGSGQFDASNGDALVDEHPRFPPSNQAYRDDGLASILAHDIGGVYRPRVMCHLDQGCFWSRRHRCDFRTNVARTRVARRRHGDACGCVDE